MQQPNRVRTYLDPDAVGPLPRSSMADDSDALSAARTILRVPGTSTVEISADDVLEVVDPNRPVRSLAPVGYDTAIVLPRRRLGWVVVATVCGAAGVLFLALVQGTAPSAAPVAAATPAARPAERPSTTPAVTTPTPASTVGTLRLDETVEGQRVFVDGVALSAPAALLQCGPHEVAMGSGRTRTIDVPCGGEVTVFR
ncbi:MAG TPA: hypothetical protein VHS09_04995 [Polyangiaceae bacterium]|jgi:hypothetical protein|nr:hypothetical protein [Polyangiaceae bacterium]